MIEGLIKYFKETPREQILKDWEESKELDKIGISALEYISKIDFLDTKIDSNSFCDLYKKQCIGKLCSVTPNSEKCEHLKKNDC